MSTNSIELKVRDDIVSELMLNGSIDTIQINMAHRTPGRSYTTKTQMVSMSEIAKTMHCQFFGDYLEKAILKCGGY